MHKSPQTETGSTMIEVLITLVLVVVGFLGLASLQLISLKNINHAHQRYVASLYAYDMVERIRSNLTQRAAYSGHVDGSESEVSCASESCNLAAVDQYQWGQEISDNLPSGTGAVELIATGLKITVTWLEQHTGEHYGQASAVAEPRSFELEVAL